MTGLLSQGTEGRVEAVSGPLLFARFAAPPNGLGYCGGDDYRSLVDHLRAGVDGPELVRLCRAFEGAWPYLRLIATSAGIRDPLDARVVEAYWIGNRLLDRVSPAAFATDLEDRFRPRTARAEWPWLAGKPSSGALPHHSFHVLEVMPRIGLLRAGHVPAILGAMGNCLIRPATVTARDGDAALVAVRPLVMDGGRLTLGGPVTERIPDVVPGIQPGDSIAVHWSRSCGPITASQVSRLERVTNEALRRANQTV